MLSMRPRKILGIVIENKTLHLAELLVGRSPRLIQHHRYDLPAELSWEKPKALGESLGQFLRKNRYSAKQVVIGLPGKWTLLKSRTLPPCNAASAAALLRLAIEREYHGTAREWSFDYLMQSATSTNTEVLLAAAPRNKLAQVAAVMETAGLNLLATVPATITRASAAVHSENAASLYVSDDGSELVIWKAGRLAAVERLVAPLQAPAMYAAEIKRMLAVHGIKASSLGINDSRDNSMVASQWQQLTDMPVTATIHDHSKNSLAAEVAQAWAAQPAATLDFQHSRVEAVVQSRITRKHTIIASIVLLVLLLVGYLGLDWYMQYRAVTDMQQQLISMNGQLVQARADIARLAHARGWYDGRPAILNALRAMTMAFPTNGQVWTTSLIIRDDMTGTLAGKAVDERAAIELIERLRATPGFTDVKFLYVRQADRSNNTVSFAMNFSYTGKD